MSSMVSNHLELSLLENQMLSQMQLTVLIQSPEQAWAAAMLMLP